MPALEPDGVLDGRDQLVERDTAVGLDRPALGGQADPHRDLLPVEGLAVAGSLDDDERRLLEALEGS